MRTQYCREHIKKTAEECDLGQEIVSRVERVSKFCASNPIFVDCATQPLYLLITVKDEDIKNKAISLAEKALKQETPTGGTIKKRLTEQEIRKLIHTAEKEIRGDLTKKFAAEKEKEPAVKKPTHAGCYQPGEVPVSDAPPIQPLNIEPDHIVGANKTMEQTATVKDSLTVQPSPFKTGLEVQAHDRNPLGIHMDAAAPKDENRASVAVMPPVDPVKALRERRIRLAKELATCYSERTQRDIQDIIHENPSWKNEEADAFYFGIEALRNPTKANIAPDRRRV